MARLFLANLLLIACIPAPTLWAGAPYEALDAGDVFVATITRVEDQGATNARPPRVWLEVHEVLRGDADVDRSPAMWSPPYHGFDYGDENLPELKRWQALPLNGPKVGEKFILGGQELQPLDGEPQDVKYGLFAFVRTPFSEQARQRSIEALAALAEVRRKSAAEQAAARKDRQVRARRWRSTFSPEKIDQLTQRADAVAIGKAVSGSTFEIERMLKGQRRMSSGGTYYITLPSDAFDSRIADLVLADRPRCVLFLSEKQLIASVTSVAAELIDPYEGLLVADPAALKAVAASLAKRPPPKPRPVLVISALDRSDAPPVADAARGTFDVVRSHQFSGHSPRTVQHVRDTIPGVDYLVMIDRGPEQRVSVVRIGATRNTTIYETTWPAQVTKTDIDTLITTITRQITP